MEIIKKKSDELWWQEINKIKIMIKTYHHIFWCSENQKEGLFSRMNVVTEALDETVFLASSSPLLLLLVHGDPPRPQGHHQQQAPDHRRGLEEVVLEEVVHGFVWGDSPEGVKGEVDAEQPDHESQSRQLCLKAHGHQDHQRRAHQVLQDLDIGSEC